MQNNIFNERDNGFAVNTISRSSTIHHTSSSFSSDSISLSATSISVNPERRNVLQRDNYSKRGELQWWIKNLTYFNGRYLIQAKPRILIQTDASMEGWGANCIGIETGGKWSVQDRKLHVNILELLAVKNVILTFTKEKTINAIHTQTDNATAFSYLLKMGGTTDNTLLDISKDIWKYLILKQSTITAEYLADIMNTRADWQSRHSKDSSEWKLSPIVFQHICQKMGIPVIDLFASKLSNQIAKHFAWKPDPHSLDTDAMQQEWT